MTETSRRHAPLPPKLTARLRGSRLRIVGALLLFAVMGNAQPLQVVCSTTDLAAIAREVAEDLAVVQSVCRGDQDPHSFEILPSHLALVRKADAYLKVGVALDMWSDDLLTASGNTKAIVVDCSQGIEIIGEHDRHHGSHGHEHPEGNPHYWLGPNNWPRIAESIRAALAAADSVHAEEYAGRAVSFTTRVDSAFAHWKELLAPCSGQSVITTHPSWDYFARDFGIEIAGVVNRLPDVEPSPMDLAKLEQTIRARNAGIFLREPFVSDRIPSLLARDTGIRVIVVPSSVGSLTAAKDLWTQFDFIVQNLAAACASR